MFEHVGIVVSSLDESAKLCGATLEPWVSSLAPYLFV